MLSTIYEQNSAQGELLMLKRGKMPNWTPPSAGISEILSNLFHQLK